MLAGHSPVNWKMFCLVDHSNNPPSSCDNQKCVETLQNVPWEIKSPLAKNRNRGEHFLFLYIVHRTILQRIIFEFYFLCDSFSNYNLKSFEFPKRCLSHYSHCDVQRWGENFKSFHKEIYAKQIERKAISDFIFISTMKKSIKYILLKRNRFRYYFKNNFCL